MQWLIFLGALEVTEEESTPTTSSEVNSEQEQQTSLQRPRRQLTLSTADTIVNESLDEFRSIISSRPTLTLSVERKANANADTLQHFLDVLSFLLDKYEKNDQAVRTLTSLIDNIESVLNEYERLKQSLETPDFQQLLSR